MSEGRKASHNSPRAWIVQGVLSLVLGLAGLVFEELVNPFGVTQAMTERSAIVLEQVAAPLRDTFATYRHRTDPGNQTDPEIGQKAVTVILIDHAFLERLSKARADPEEKFGGCLLADPPLQSLDPVRADDENASPEPSNIRWPMPISLLARCVLWPIAYAKPKAIFLDIYFPDVARQLVPGGPYSRQHGAEMLARMLNGDYPEPSALRAWQAAALERFKTEPLLIAEALTEKSGFEIEHDARQECVKAKDIEDLLQNSRYLRSALDAGRGGHGRSVEVVSARWHGSTDVYPLAPQIVLPEHLTCGEAQRGQPTFLLSPAMRLYQWYRYSGPGAGSDALTTAFGTSTDTWTGSSLTSIGFVPQTLSRDDAFGEAEARELKPLWTNRLSAGRAQVQTQADACAPNRRSGVLSDLKAAFVTLLGSIRGPEEEPDGERCTYIDTFFAEDLFADGRNPDRLKAFLRNRVVMVGLDLSLGNDQTISPLGQRLPGVYTHAAAFENLVRYGDRFHSRKAGLPSYVLIVFLAVIAPKGTGLILKKIKTITDRGLERIAPKRETHSAVRKLVFCKSTHQAVGVIVEPVEPDRPDANPLRIFARVVARVGIAAVAILLLICIQTLAGVALLLGTALEAGKVAMPVFAAFLPVWLSVLHAFEEFVRELIGQNGTHASD